jgi:hypothetical protein
MPQWWNEAVYCVCEWLCTHTCCWFPMAWNKGFAGSGFLSMSIALNVAIAKWEPLRKSLVDTAAQFDEIYNRSVAEKKENSAVLADERFKDRIEIAKNLCRKFAANVRSSNEAIWLRFRPIAIYSSYVAGVALFFQLSLGILALLLLAAPCAIWVSTSSSKRKIKKEVEGRFTYLIDTVKEEQLVASPAEKSKIERTIE